MLYNIPKCTGTALEPSTLIKAARHEHIVAVKDATGDIDTAARVLNDTDLAYYSGEDALNLPCLSVGFSGFVSVVGHFAAHLLREMLESFTTGNVTRALAIHRLLLPIYTGAFRAPAAASVKAGLSIIGMSCGKVRLSLTALTA